MKILKNSKKIFNCYLNRIWFQVEGMIMFRVEKLQLRLGMTKIPVSADIRG